MSKLTEALVFDLEQLARIEDEIAKLKLLYVEYDAIVCKLQAQGFTEAEHAGRTFTLTDNFAKGNTAYRMAFIKHYEIKISKPK